MGVGKPGRHRHPWASRTEGCLGNSVSKAECSFLLAVCVPVKAKVCWEMGGVTDKSCSPGNFAGWVIHGVVEERHCREPWKLSAGLSEVFCSSFNKKGLSPRKGRASPQIPLL